MKFAATLALLLLACIAAHAPVWAAAPQPIRATAILSAGQSAQSSQGAVMVSLTLTNPNPRPVQILVDQLPIGELTAPLFEVSIDGTPAPYLGIIALRSPPVAADYLWLAAGERRRFEVDLAKYYGFTRTGNYRIRFHVESLQLHSPQGPGAAGRLESNWLTLRVAGRVLKASPGILPDVVSGSNTFSACSAERQSLLTAARSDASAYVDEAAGYFAAGRNGARYVRWFGSYTPDRWTIVKTHFDRIRNALDTATIEFDCNCTVQNPEIMVAYVFPPRPFRIHLCNGYWRAESTGSARRAAVLVHEMSHFTVLGGTLDFVYGQVDSMALAVSHPDKAVISADNHAYFAQNQPPTPDVGGGPLTITPLANGAIAPGLAGVQGTEIRFSIVVPAGATVLRIQTSGGSGDPDLYVRFDALPTQEIHDCKSDADGTIDQCLLPQPSAGIHHILVSGFTEFSDVALSVGFTPGPPTISVAATGTGSGRVVSDPAGIDCGASCNAQYGAGESVRLTATADPASSFSGWSGECAGTQRECRLSVDGPRRASAIFSQGAAGAALDQPAVARLGLPSPSPANAGCPAGFFVVSASDGPGAGVNPGTFGMEVLLDSPGTRVLAGGLNFGGLIDAGQPGFAGFTIANAANEPQTVNLLLHGSPANDANGSLAVSVRVARVPDAATQQTVFEARATISATNPYQTSLPLQPGFYAVTVAAAGGAIGGAADGQFQFSLTTRYIDRPGGGFQGGAVVGGYHATHPFGGVSGFAGFCLASAHSTSVRLLSQPSYGTAGARDLQLRVHDAQQRELAVVPGN